MDSELKKLVESYQPSAETVQAMRQVRLVATVGPSATGKTTIMKALAAIQPSVHFVVGETSRAPRIGEQNGVDLSFRDIQDILDDLHAGRLTQVVTGPNGDLYCTRVENFPVGKICVFPLVPKGIIQFRALPLGFFKAAFIVPASFELWQTWLNNQAKISNWGPEKLQGRLAEAKASFEFALNDQRMNFVLNDKVEKAAARLYQVACGEDPADEQKARQTAVDNFAKLNRI